ncbi:TM2 domain-containing protein [Paenibacillus sp. Z6-24]
MLTRYELSPQELMLLNSELRPREKSLALSYLMLIGGHLGVHRFYLRRTVSAIIQLVLFLLAMAAYFGLVFTAEFNNDASGLFLGLTLLTGFPLFVWIVIDLFLIPRMVRDWNQRAEHDVLQQIEWLRQNPPPAREPMASPASAVQPAGYQPPQS